MKNISIHAARMGCDESAVMRLDSAFHFNPRSPRGLRHRPAVKNNHVTGDFNPRSPRGLRQTSEQGARNQDSISIHAAQEGCDF